ncbi:MAG: TolC family protein [Deltaproteobacteria bacterium]|nr:TolC family protein [Deltaproteobacteria bacterium]
MEKRFRLRKYGQLKNSFRQLPIRLTARPPILQHWSSGPTGTSSSPGKISRYSKSRINARLLRQQIKKTVRTAIRDVELAIKAVEATRKTSLATRKRLEAEQIKFESGRSTTLDVLIAQDAYSKALSQENLTNIAYADTLAELDRIQGLITLTSAP